MSRRHCHLAPWAPSAPAAPGQPSIGADATLSAPAAPPFPAEWFRENVERLWRIVARLGVPHHGVDDIVQEAFIIASRRRADIQPGHERRFLIATAIKLCANYRNRAHVRREVSHDGNFDSAPSPALNAEQLLIEKRGREVLDRLLAELSDAHRTAFVLYELEGLSVPEIAELEALPLGTISSRLWRARAKFSELAASLQVRADREDR